ncbi:hypothetical protein NLU13_6841 [Sarocladium strictum]|uniref:Uncharacterized protein n=1 Tax=Sarocladium strictum TaxID=5046 RepID=A0AA39GET7_SARSR|nr:hypothetical protein NLU13_6841 [Sarocladium strictum]
MSYSTLTTLTTTLSDGSTSVYPWYYYVPIPTVISIPPVTTTEIPIWGFSLNTSATDGTALLTSSVQPPPMVVTVTPVLNGTTSIIGATATSTSSGAVVIWQGKTDILPPGTATLGGSTTIIGGITLPPHVTTLTPNPHPTTVQTTPDPVINPKTIPWTSGKPPGPTSRPGCPGCGLPCLLFCDPDCPFCPPGVFGNPNGDGDGDDDDDNTSSSASTSEAASATVLAAEDIGDEFAPLVTDSALLASLFTLDIAAWDSLYPDTPVFPSTTTTTSSTSTAVTTTAVPSPSAECYLWVSASQDITQDHLTNSLRSPPDQDFIAYEIEIFNIQGWASDSGAELREQESGCGALTFWTWHDTTDDKAAYVSFDLPTLIKAGCVQRAIVSAGGPKLSCQGKGNTFRVEEPGSAEVKNAAPPVSGLTEEKLGELVKVYGNHSDERRAYVPMDWGETEAASTTLAFSPWK